MHGHTHMKYVVYSNVKAFILLIGLFCFACCCGVCFLFSLYSSFGLLNCLLAVIRRAFLLPVTH